MINDLPESLRVEERADGSTDEEVRQAIEAFESSEEKDD